MLQKWQLEKHSQMKTGTSPSPMRLESMIQAALAQDTSFPLTWPSWLHPCLLCSEKELSGTSSVKSHLHWGCLLLPQVGASWTEDLWDLGVKLPPKRFMFQKRYHLEPWPHTYLVVRASQATIAERLKKRRGHYFKVSSSFNHWVARPEMLSKPIPRLMNHEKTHQTTWWPHGIPWMPPLTPWDPLAPPMDHLRPLNRSLCLIDS